MKKKVEEDKYVKIGITIHMEFLILHEKESNERNTI